MKYQLNSHHLQQKLVALLVSAWIEISNDADGHLLHIVALLVSAWIEICFGSYPLRPTLVALLVSAWIEMIL